MGILLALLIACSTTNAFTSTFTGKRFGGNVSTISRRSSRNLNMFFGGAKDDGSPGDYICKDCGYVFTKGPAAWAKLDDKYGCPPCGAPKFRFKKVPKGSSSGKVEVKKSWFG